MTTNEPRNKLDSIANRTFSISKIVVCSITLLTGILLIIFIFVEGCKDCILLESFAVPKNIEAQGYSGQALANKLLDQFVFIKTHSATTKKGIIFEPVWEQTKLEIKVEGVGVSITSVSQYIRNLLGLETSRVVSEIVLIDEKTNLISLTTRILGKPTKTFCGKLENLDSLLLQASEHIYKYTQPYILAAYFSEFDKKACLETIQYLLSNKPTEDDCWGYNLWGILLEKEGNYKEATEKYRLSIELNPHFANPHYNLGQLLALGDKREEAIAEYTNVVKNNPKFTEAYCALAWELLQNGKHKDALEKIKMAIKQDTENANAYNVKGNYCFYKAQPKEALTCYKRAIDLQPQNIIPYQNICELLIVNGQAEDASQYINKIMFLSYSKKELLLAYFYQFVTKIFHGRDTKDTEKWLDTILDSADSPDFFAFEFHNPIYSVKRLCQAIDSITPPVSLKSKNNTIKYLNELLTHPDFYEILRQNQDNINFSAKVMQLIAITNTAKIFCTLKSTGWISWFEYQKPSTSPGKDFIKLIKDEHNNVKKLNRLILEETYPRETPKFDKLGRSGFDFSLTEKWLEDSTAINADKKNLVTEKIALLKKVLKKPQ